MTTPARALTPVVVHAMPGRVRLRIAALRCARHAGMIEATARRLPVVRSANASTLSGTILLHCDPRHDAVSVARSLTRALGVDDTSVDSPSPDEAAPPPATAPRPAANSISDWHLRQYRDVLDELDATADGLARAEARRRLARVGPNLVPSPPEPTLADAVLRQVLTAPVALLGASAAIAIATGGLVDAAAIGVVVAINTAIGVATERQAEKTIRSLAIANPDRVTVWRKGRQRKVTVEDLVPGDVLALAPGAWIGADARLVDCRRLSVDESALTGESLPAPKTVAPLPPGDVPLGDRHNMVYRGTFVTGGSGRAVVVATGIDTELGAIQAATGEVKAPDTPMQRQLDALGTQLAVISAGACVAVFGLGLLRRLPLVDSVKSSISLGVAAVPEGLPAVATTTLALGIADMRQRKASVRHLGAVEALGSVQTLCLDKTGTLTRNRMTVTRLLVEDTTIEPEKTGIGDLPKGVAVTLSRLLETAALCNEAKRGDSGRLEGSATEAALLRAAMDAGLDIDVIRRRTPLLETHYRSTRRRYMYTAHRDRGGKVLLAVKGSPDELLPLCGWELRAGRRHALTPGRREALARENDRWAGDALRVLGVAYARGPSATLAEAGELTWLGLAGLSDPLRSGVDRLVTRLHQAGIDTVMITGDQTATALSVGEKLGLAGTQPLRVLESADLSGIEPELLRGLAPETQVFARVSPTHKLEIVQALQEGGRVVAMTGDGINDGPALKAADVGIAMGSAQQDVAHSVADVVIQDDRLTTILDAVGRGRSIYGNIRKSIHYLLSTNMSEIEVMLGALALGLPSPLTPLQLLWINLATDIFPGLALALERPEPDVLKRPPRDPDEAIVPPSSLRRIFLESGVITVGALAAYLLALRRYGPGERSQGVAFSTLTTAQLLHAWACRSSSLSIFERAGMETNAKLNSAIIVPIAMNGLGVLLPPVARLFGARLGVRDLVTVAAGAGLPLLVNEWLKSRRARLENETASSGEERP